MSVPIAAPYHGGVTSAEASSVPETRPIRVLSNLVASQIAAGEVVERPASVVKELAENAIDAGATRVAVELEQGGVELVRVTDNGGGIAKGDLPLAIAPHATSKVSSIDDLDHIATLGFRGEALASIASVSRLSIRSRTAASHEAFELVSEGDVVQPIRPTSGPVGTSVSVRNLFFNTPARRKFLRTTSTEQGRCHDTLLAIAMAHPLIGVRLVIDGKVVFDLPPDQTPQQRILDLIGKELEPELLVVQSDQHDVRGVSLFGLIGTPSIASTRISANPPCGSPRWSWSTARPLPSCGRPPSAFGWPTPSSSSPEGMLTPPGVWRPACATWIISCATPAPP